MNAHDRARRFHALHQAGMLILPNAWDAASAALVAGCGAPAVATTSSGIAWALGVPDGENLRRSEMVEAVARIARVVEVPVSADLEAGYGPEPADVAATIEAAIDAGASGANLEDRNRSSDEILWPVDQQGERLAAARAAADRRGLPFVLNARTDVYLAAVGDPDQREAMTLERARHYQRAGADCLFVPGLLDLAVIERLVARSPLPINIMYGPGAGLTIADLRAAGVRRVSVGQAIASAAYYVVRAAAAQLLAGDDTALQPAIPHREMQRLLTRPAA
ncbi:MAG TPA: isocitrate lyase/phosphoenolpyruvate mutase family protein [Candidatus Dormibacteraeota bacterium]|nr:isocitrate lyase/phosphoenolpyruvate mutase family protein [Candidatus Dormibacteraeota bacterium]